MSFTPVQNFDGLSPQTTKGDLISRSTTTAVKVTVGSDGQALLADSTQASGVKWGAASANWNYTAQSSTYNPAAINDYISCSGASFTITLPTAVGNSGKSIGIEHNGTSLTQVYTLATTSSQTIAGVAGGSYALYTANEVVIVTSNGANWLVTGRQTAVGWTTSAQAATVITGTSSDPTKASSITADGMVWRRIGGNTCEVLMTLLQGGTAGSAAGVGDYLWALPTNISISSSAMSFFTTVIGVADASLSNCIGYGTLRLAAANCSWRSFVVVARYPSKFHPLRKHSKPNAPPCL